MNDLTIEWFNQHNFPYKKIGSHYFWQTNFQTGEIWTDKKEETHIKWHEKEYFNKVLS